MVKKALKRYGQGFRHFTANISYLVQGRKAGQWVNLIRFDDSANAQRYIAFNTQDNTHDVLRLIEESRSRITGVKTQQVLLQSDNNNISTFGNQNSSAILKDSSLQDGQQNLLSSNEVRSDPQLSLLNNDQNLNQPSLWSDKELFTDQLDYRGYVKRRSLTGKGYRPEALEHEVYLEQATEHDEYRNTLNHHTQAVHIDLVDKTRVDLPPLVPSYQSTVEPLLLSNLVENAQKTENKLSQEDSDTLNSDFDTNATIKKYTQLDNHSLKENVLTEQEQDDLEQKSKDIIKNNINHEPQVNQPQEQDSNNLQQNMRDKMQLIDSGAMYEGQSSKNDETIGYPLGSSPENSDIKSRSRESFIRNGTRAPLPANSRVQRSRQRRAAKVRGNRTALASGLIVGVIAAGMAITVANPDVATRVVFSLERDARKMLPESDLIKAVRARNSLEVKGLLETGTDPNVRDKYGKPALLIAANLGDLTTLSFLIKGGADVSIDSGDGRSIMHRLAIEGQMKALERLLKLGAPSEVPGGAQGCWTPIAAAIAYEQREVVEVLANYGASLDPSPGCATGPLDVADGLPKIQAQLDRILITRTESSLELGPESEINNQYANNYSPKRIQKLEAGQKLAGIIPSGAGSALLADFAGAVERAVRNGNVTKLRELIEERPEGVILDHIQLDRPDSFGNNRLNLVDFVALENQWDMTNALVAAGLQPSIRALHFSIDHANDQRYRGLLEHLLQNGSNPDSVYDDYTPLMRAAALNRTSEIRTLLAAGADPRTKNKQGQNAAYFASLSGNLEMQEILVLSAYESDYHHLMLGLSWRDTYDSLKSKLGKCQELANEFVACKLNANKWLEMSPVNVILQFDKTIDSKLVALQIDSYLLDNPEQARFAFDRTLSKISAALPDQQKSFVNRQETEGIPLFQALLPEVQMATYSSFWSDDKKRHPVYLQLKLRSVSNKKGYLRVIIGNPFRAS